jgi:hypothetical protein
MASFPTLTDQNIKQFTARPPSGLPHARSPLLVRNLANYHHFPTAQRIINPAMAFARDRAG